MPGYSARSIANEFLKRNGGPMEQMKLQKLVYIANGWNLAINRSPLVSDRFEAWDGGPVVRTIWNHFKALGFNIAPYYLGDRGGKADTADLSSSEVSVLDHVWSKYSQYSGFDLSEMTHQPGTPWSNTYFGQGRNHALSQSDIQQHFVELALAGRSQTT